MNNHQADSVLSVQDLKVEISRNSILNGASFSVQRGETLGIIGPNGSGKTTLFNCLSGFMKPSAGQIIFRGQDITNSRAFFRARLGLGRVFQNSGVFRNMTLLENLVLALESSRPGVATWLPWGRKIAAYKAESMALLDEVGLKAKAHEKASSLSGGQLRLVEIMRTLASRAEILLLDEPTAGVSPKMKGQVAELICKVRDQGKTILVIEHDLQFIQQFCKRVIVLDGGKVVLDDTPEKVRNNSSLQEIYFGRQGDAG